MLPLGAAAQTPVRTLSGTVTDTHHEPMRGAVVQLENETTHAVTSYITDASGRYSFKRLQGDADYSVRSTYRGQGSKTRTLSLFDTRAEATINLVVRPRRDD